VATTVSNPSHVSNASLHHCRRGFPAMFMSAFPGSLFESNRDSIIAPFVPLILFGSLYSFNIPSCGRIYAA
jgi:hypothetical protein